MEFSLRCDFESLEISRSEAIWGSVWIESCGEVFPEFEWNDMPVAFTCELASVLEAARGKSFRSGRVRFFDGPFWVMVDCPVPGECVVTLGGSGGSKALAMIPMGKIVESVRSIARGLLEACHSRGWGGNPDVIRLANCLESLR
ncbi:hypothetical protein [Streptomyces sp. GQFP]|uniref:hypothetical protein n=1 Tax=Streptomyces sp. GQFP TaxID=2907545 RepID=UPI001F1CD09B|nr:hypothetical protein [Streptomyces sp. GQFP]UIX35157.1 hypothetical protein LUX31_37015 [Streptomyces sp. GQFP]